MPLELIPNQPFIFENPIGAYPCLNNDPKHYAQLVQDGDITCVQWKLGACGASPLCEPDMVMETPGSNELGAWTATGGWSTSGSCCVSFDGTGDPGGDANQSFATTEIGSIYKVSFTVDVYTGNLEYELATDFEYFTFNSSGYYEFYFTAKNAVLGVYFIVANTATTNAGDTIEISGLSVVQWTDCWLDELPDDLPTWSYAFSAGQGKFCSTDTTQGDLINTTAFSQTGNYHGVTLVISDATQGGIEVRLGGVLLGTTSGNGEQGFYGVPTAGTDLVLTKTGDFDGCVSQVNVEDYGEPGTSMIRVTNESVSNFANITPTVIKDRLIACIDWENLTWSTGKAPDDCTPLKIQAEDPCDDTIVYTSVNRALYKEGATWECTKLVESWNDGYAFGFYFGDIASPDFKLTQRLRVLAFNPVYRNAGEEYLYSSGNSGRSFAQSQKARTAWFDYMDEYAHDCTRTQLLGQKLFIEGYAFYYPTEDYEPEWNENGRYNLAQSRVTVFHEEAIFGSACGVMANTVCPPQVVIEPFSYTQLSIKVDDFDISFLNEIDELTTALYIYDSTGNIVDAIATVVYDFTNAGNRASWLNDVRTFIDTNYSTTSTGSITYNAGILNIDITAPITGTPPIDTMSISINESPSVFVNIPQSIAISVIYS
jgi:hypothetical protein